MKLGGMTLEKTDRKSCLQQRPESHQTHDLCPNQIQQQHKSKSKLNVFKELRGELVHITHLRSGVMGVRW